MADIIYNRAKGPIDISDLRAILLVGYTPDVDHATLTAVIAAATKEADFASYARQPLTGVAWSVDDVNNWAILDAENPLWEAATAGQTLSHMVIYEHHSDEDDDLNLPVTAHGTGFPVETDGTDLLVKLPTGILKSA